MTCVQRGVVLRVITGTYRGIELHLYGNSRGTVPTVGSICDHFDGILYPY